MSWARMQNAGRMRDSQIRRESCAEIGGKYGTADCIKHAWELSSRKYGSESSEFIKHSTFSLKPLRTLQERHVINYLSVLFVPRALKERLSARCCVSLRLPLKRSRTEMSLKFVIVPVKDQIWSHVIVFCKWAVLPRVIFSCCTCGRCSFALSCEGAICLQLLRPLPIT